MGDQNGQPPKGDEATGKKFTRKNLDEKKTMRVNGKGPEPKKKREEKAEGKAQEKIEKASKKKAKSAAKDAKPPKRDSEKGKAVK